MTRMLRWLGSLAVAVPLLISIAVVLAWGTLYETRFGTAAVQRFIYQSWWFQAVLGFLAVNLAVAAWERYPWKRKHVPFVLAHLGIILILVGGILGGRFGIEGQLIIPEGQAQRTLQLSRNLLVIRQANPGIDYTLPVSFETTAWIHEPTMRADVPLDGRRITLAVDRYYPNAHVTELITGDGEAEHPAIQVALSSGDHQETFWLFARDPQRRAGQWGELHVLFIEPLSERHRSYLVGSAAPTPSDRGVVVLEWTDGRRQEMAVPRQLGQPRRIAGTPYTITFKDVFTDFAITPHGVANRSEAPNNPAVALTIAGLEGTDPFLVFALHPEFPKLHSHQRTIGVKVFYVHPLQGQLPANALTIVWTPSGAMTCVGTDAQGKKTILPCAVGQAVRHPSLDVTATILQVHARAKITPQFTNRSNEVKREALHVVAREGNRQAEGWVWQGASTLLALGGEPLEVSYRPDEHELPVTIKLLDFRKIDYPGTDMAAGFESDVELTDPQRGIILLRTIKMNQPLRYRGFSFYQASYIPGPIETTVLAVRSDPGTPLVYAGFLIVVAGIVWMFVVRSPSERAKRKRSR